MIILISLLKSFLCKFKFIDENNITYIKCSSSFTKFLSLFNHIQIMIIFKIQQIRGKHACSHRISECDIDLKTIIFFDFMT